MENNSDKEMRDKLRGVELPFDPKAWEQMDAMLEKDRKPKAFLWWWMSGVAAVLILGAGIYGYNQFTNSHAKSDVLASTTEKPNNNTIVNSTESNESGAISGHAGKAVANNQLNTPNITTKETVPEAKQPQAKGEALNYANNQPVGLKVTASVKKPVKNRVSAGNKNTSTGTQHSNKQKAHAIKTAKKNDPGTNSNSQLQTGSTALSAASGLNVTGFADGLSNFLSQRFKDELSELLNMQLMGPEPLTTCEENDENDFKKKDGDDVDLKKLKKKVPFAYSLGVAANITGTTLGNQGSPNIFEKKPSYMVGITQDFTFLKRMAITSGFMFAQTGFTVPDFNYTCALTEFNIPIGLKAYLVSKSKVRFYVDAGIINHIKLKETFAPIYVVSSPTSVTGNNFGPLPNTLGISSVNAGSSSANEAADAPYSINRGKHYYASFYTGAGAEFTVKSRLVFFTEPVFYMSLEKVLAPDRYKYDLGLSCGFRYRF